MQYIHSVTLDREECHGCTNCIKKCPTEAIRVRGGKAKIIKKRCIDCGECIRVCPYHAKKAVTDSLEELKSFKYNIALPAPSFYAQFGGNEEPDKILTALLSCGFDDVLEVAVGAESVSRLTRELLSEGSLKKPVISSACPAVVRLIQKRFPNLIENIIPVLSPMEVTAMAARREARKKTGLSDEEIGVFFITPCPAKVTEIRFPLTLEKSYVSGAVSTHEMYAAVLPLLKNIEKPLPLSRAGFGGISWARSGGESENAGDVSYIAVDGIENVINILEEIEYERLSEVDFVEMSACTGGCVGGSLQIENPFVSKARINNLKNSGEKAVCTVTEPTREEMLWKKHIAADRYMQLDDDFEQAMRKLERVEKIHSNMPKLDCGSCGAPSCRALAEDIVLGYNTENDCIFKMRERVRELATELSELETVPYEE